MKRKPKSKSGFNLGRNCLKAGGFLVLTVVVAVAFYTVITWPQFDRIKSGLAQSSDLLAAEVLEGFKISTLTYRYTNVVYETEAKTFFGRDLPLTRRHLAVSYDGVMEIGIDGQQIGILEATEFKTDSPQLSPAGETDETTAPKRALLIELPPAQVLSHTPVTDSTQVLFDLSGGFHANKVGDYLALFNLEQREMERQAAALGLLEQAQASAREQLTAFLTAIPAIRDNYELVFLNS